MELTGLVIFLTVYCITSSHSSILNLPFGPAFCLRGGYLYGNMLTFSLSFGARFGPIAISSGMLTKFYPSVLTVVEFARLELSSGLKRNCWIG
ncbi:hypothetical protein LINPERPRIM_LOCUS36855 [Linum perenne]